MGLSLANDLSLMGVRPSSGGSGGSGPPDTGNVKLDADAASITGKSDADTVATGEWPDGGPDGLPFNVVGTPKYRTNRVNGHPSVQFDGASSGVFVGSVEALIFHIFLVLRDNEADATNRYLLDGSSTHRQVLWHTGTEWRYDDGDDQFVLSVDDDSFGSFCLVEVVATNTSSQVLLNGSSVGLDSSTVPEHWIRCHLGARWSDIGFCEAEYARVVVLDNPSAQDVLDWRSYLQTRYGL